MIELLFGPDPLGSLALALRATVVLGLAVLLAAAFRGRAAQTRHVLWTTTFVVLIALPVLTVWGPEWTLSVLPSAPAAHPPGLHFEAGPPAAEPGRQGSPMQSPAPPGDFPAVPSRQGEPTRSGFASGAFLVWAMGALLALMSLVVGVSRFRKHVRDGRPLDDPAWTAHLEALRRRLGISRDVKLCVSPSVRAPMTGGWRRPVILVPESAAVWSPECRHIVLTHELIHVHRHDALRQVVGRLALALYWLHPLSWVAARLSAVSREQACDEGVLALGARPSRYASFLLDLAGGRPRSPAVLALPMVQRSQLERRVMAILDPRRPRPSPSTTTLAAVTLGALGVMAAVARPVPAEVPAAQEAPLPVPAPTAQTPIPAARAAPAPRPPPTIRAAPRAPAPPRVVAPPTPVQEADCQVRGLGGAFSGSMNATGGRYQMSGTVNGDRIIQRYVDDVRLCMRVHGNVVMSNDGSSVRAVGADSWVVLESEEDALSRLVITGRAGQIEYAWSVDGRERPFDAEAREWRDAMFSVLEGYWQASRLRGEQSRLRGKISSARGHVSSLNGQISTARGRVSSLRGRISTARGRVSTLNGRISSYRGHVSSLNGRISSIRGQMSRLRSAARATSDAETRNRLGAELEEQQRRIERVRRELEDYDVEARIRDTQRQLAEFDVEARVREVQRQLDDYDIDSRVEEIGREIEEYDLDGRVRKIEREITELDADGRAAAIERDIQPELDALLRLIRRI